MIDSTCEQCQKTTLASSFNPCTGVDGELNCSCECHNVKHTPIDITTLQSDDEGRWVYYIHFDGTKEIGRLSSWNENNMFVVFKCADQWVDYANYTGQSCNPNDLEWKHEDASDKQTVTLFRKFKSDKQVIALFVEQPFKQNDWYSCMSYMHFGQHGESHLPTVMENTDSITTYYGYRDLMAELVSIGYNIKVTDKLLPEYQKSRRATLNQWKDNQVNG